MIDNCLRAEELKVESYCNGLIDQNFVNVSKGNFLTQELEVHRAKGLAGRQRPPMGQLWKKQTAHHHILHAMCLSVSDHVCIWSLQP